MTDQVARDRYLKMENRKLIQILVDEFHLFIRNRDQGKPCISCYKVKTLQAGHFFKAGSCSALRFHEMNVHGQCGYCNVERNGNESGYQKGLIERYGAQYLLDLNKLHDEAKKQEFHWDKESLISSILRYRKINQINK